MDIRGPTSAAARFVCSSDYIGSMKGERFHGFGQVHLQRNDVYCGDLHEGRRDGLGTMSWGDGLQYVGPWIANEATGQGLLSWPNGTEYYGDVLRGRRQGNGVMLHKSNVYCGEWHNGVRHGFGTQASPALVYVGEWVQGKRHGWGSAQFASGNVYCGRWANDALDGFGTMTWVRRSGPAANHTATQQQDDSSSMLEGDAFHGNASTPTSSGTSPTKKATTTFVSHGIRPPTPDLHGPALAQQLRKIVANIGAVQPGPLGPFTPSVMERDSALERYEGEFRNGKPHGHGSYELCFFDGDARDIPFETSNRFEGQFRNGMREGHGVQLYADGTCYDGEWSANMKHGKGFIIHPDGTRDAVEMQHDVPKMGRPTQSNSLLTNTAATTGEVDVNGGGGGTASSGTEASLDIRDLFPTKRDRESLREVIARHKATLKHLYIVYAKRFVPEDYASMVLRLNEHDGKVSKPYWQDRDDVKALVLPEGIATTERNTRMVTKLAQTAERRARDAAQRALQNVKLASEKYLASVDTLRQQQEELLAAARKGSQEDELLPTSPAGRHSPDYEGGGGGAASSSFTPRAHSAFAEGFLDQTDGSPSRRRRPATPPAADATDTKHPQLIELPAMQPPPRRVQQQSHLLLSQFLRLLRDAHIADDELNVTVINRIVWSVLDRHAASSSSSSTPTNSSKTKPLRLPPAADFPHQEVPFGCFVEILLRLSDQKLNSTSTFACVNAKLKMGLADRFSYLLEHFLTPLRYAVVEIELSQEPTLRIGNWPLCNGLPRPNENDATLDDLRRQAMRALRAEQTEGGGGGGAASAAALNGSSSTKQQQQTSSASKEKSAAKGGKKGKAGDSSSGGGDTLAAEGGRPTSPQLSNASNLDADDGALEEQLSMQPLSQSSPLTPEVFDTATVARRVTHKLSNSLAVEAVCVVAQSTRGCRRSHWLLLLNQLDPSSGEVLSTSFYGILPAYELIGKVCAMRNPTSHPQYALHVSLSHSVGAAPSFLTPPPSTLSVAAMSEMVLQEMQSDAQLLVATAEVGNGLAREIRTLFDWFHSLQQGSQPPAATASTMTTARTGTASSAQKQQQQQGSSKSAAAVSPREAALVAAATTTNTAEAQAVEIVQNPSLTMALRSLVFDAELLSAADFLSGSTSSSSSSSSKKNPSAALASAAALLQKSIVSLSSAAARNVAACCPNAFLPTAAALLDDPSRLNDDPQLRQLLRVCPELADAVSIVGRQLEIRRQQLALFLPANFLLMNPIERSGFLGGAERLRQQQQLLAAVHQQDPAGPPIPTPWTIADQQPVTFLQFVEMVVQLAELFVEMEENGEFLLPKEGADQQQPTRTRSSVSGASSSTTTFVEPVHPNPHATGPTTLAAKVQQMLQRVVLPKLRSALPNTSGGASSSSSSLKQRTATMANAGGAPSAAAAKRFAADQFPPPSTLDRASCVRVATNAANAAAGGLEEKNKGKQKPGSGKK